MSERESVDEKMFSVFVELLSCPDTPHVVKLLHIHYTWMSVETINTGLLP